jgi:putative DNA primase/helicase
MTLNSENSTENQDDLPKTPQERFIDRFSGLTRVHGVYLTPGHAEPGHKREGKRWTAKEPVTPELWTEHLAGRAGLGIVPIRDDDTCLWGCGDIDDYSIDHKKLLAKIAELKLPLVVCRTKSGGAHCFLFGSEPLPAALVRDRLKEWMTGLGFPRIEIFPKQSSLSEGSEDSSNGSWLNLPYFAGDRTTRYGLDPETAASMSIEDFLTLADANAITVEQLENWEELPAPVEGANDLLPQGPPCLNTLCGAGVAAGTRNEVMFNLAVYYNKVDPNTALEQSMKASREFFTPPLSPREASITISSALKRDYNYRCKNEPLAGVCVKKTCLTRAFGISNGIAKVSRADAVAKQNARPQSDYAAIISPYTPYITAEKFVATRSRKLLCYAGDFYEWRTSYYAKLNIDDMRAELYNFMNRCGQARQVMKETVYIPFEVAKHLVDATIDALRGFVHVDSGVAPPCWMDHREAPATLLSCRNGLVDILTGEVFEHSEHFFNVSATKFDYDPNCGEPETWLKFLNEILPNDQESIDALQELFGYILSGDTSQQKMFLLVGASRSGKGTINRILQALMGGTGHASIPLGSFGEQFALQPLLGKSLATIPDARIDRRSHVGVERLLAISGEDTLDVGRKNTTTLNSVHLKVRFLFLTNVLPELADPSGTIATRFIVWWFAQSFLGREDRELFGKLCVDLPKILRWSIVGYRRLQARGHFTQPEAGAAKARDILHRASPITGFIDSHYVLDPNGIVLTDDVYMDYCNWHVASGQPGDAGTKTALGMKLGAAFPQIENKQLMINRKRDTYYAGLRPIEQKQSELRMEDEYTKDAEDSEF